MPTVAPSPDEIRRIAAEVLQRPDYVLEGDVPATGGDSLLIRALRWVLDAFVALAASLSFLGVLAYPVAALLCVVLVLLIYRMLRTLARSTRLAEESEEQRQTRSARATSPEELETQALSAQQNGRIVEAVRWLLRAAMLRIEIAEKRKPRPGTTNRELLRRYRSTPLQQPLQTLVDTIDVHWYGDRPAEAADYERCQASYEQLRETMVRRAEPRSEARISKSEIRN